MTVFTISVENVIEIWLGIVLDLYIFLHTLGISTMLSPLAWRPGRPFSMFVSSSFIHNLCFNFTDLS